MTSFGGISPSTDVSEQASHIHMPDYVLVFRDNRPPKEYAFTAISDDAAKDLMCKQYPRFAWTLYHVEGRDQRELLYSYPGQPGRAGGEGSTA
jgi:hypothetical protein